MTAPLRRLADRYATHVCLRLTEGAEIDESVRSALPRLPEAMERSGRLAAAAARGAVDLAESAMLANRVGEEFDAVVLDTNTHGSRLTIAVEDPPVRARCTGTARLGERIRVRLAQADPEHRVVQFDQVA